jgi:hypothetical protein
VAVVTAGMARSPRASTAVLASFKPMDDCATMGALAA